MHTFSDLNFGTCDVNVCTYLFQVAFFVADVYSRDCDIKLQALKIDDNSEILHKAVIQSIVENSTTRNVKRMRDLILHRYEDDKRVSLVVENKVRTLSIRVHWVFQSFLGPFLLG